MKRFAEIWSIIATIIIVILLIFLFTGQSGSNLIKEKVISYAGENITFEEIAQAYSQKTIKNYITKQYQNLYEQGAVSKQTLDAAQVKYDGAKAGLTQAQQALHVAQEHAHP